MEKFQKTSDVGDTNDQCISPLRQVKNVMQVRQQASLLISAQPEEPLC